jgi:hypothetical protein
VDSHGRCQGSSTLRSKPVRHRCLEISFSFSTVPLSTSAQSNFAMEPTAAYGNQDKPPSAGPSATELTQQRLHVLNDPLEAVSPHPALHLLIGRRPGTEIVWHQAPLVATLHHIPHGVEDRPQIVLADSECSTTLACATVFISSLVEPPSFHIPDLRSKCGLGTRRLRICER